MGVARFGWHFMLAKRTADLIPLCHPLAHHPKSLLKLTPDPICRGFRSKRRSRTSRPDRVEMEHGRLASVTCADRL